MIDPIAHRLRTGAIPVFLVMAALGLAGCETMPWDKGNEDDQEISEREHEDITPFAQQTIESAAASDLAFRYSDLYYLRDYVDPKSPEMVRLSGLLASADLFRDHAIRYSVRLVQIADQKIPEPDMCSLLAESVNEQFRADLSGLPGWDATRFDALVADIASQTRLLAALRAVQPLFDASADAYEDLVSEVVDDALPAMRASVDAAIEADFAMLRANRAGVLVRRDKVTADLLTLAEYRSGNRAALGELKSGGSLSASPTARELDNLEQDLMGQFRQLTEIENGQQSDVKDYLRTRQELDREEFEVLEALTLARLQYLAWVRAHQDLSEGVKDPSKWLEVVKTIADIYKKIK